MVLTTKETDILKLVIAEAKAREDILSARLAEQATMAPLIAAHKTAREALATILTT